MTALVPEADSGGAPAQRRKLRAQGRKTMRRLLDAGLSVFEAKGFHAARVDDIVEAARTSHGTFYLYFSNKEDLFRALAGETAAEMNDVARSLGPVAADRAGYEELHAWLARFVEVLARHRAVLRAWQDADTSADLVRLGIDKLGEFTDIVVTRIAESVPDDIGDPQVSAIVFVAMVERLSDFLRIRDIGVRREEVLDQLATITHVGVFGGTRIPGAASGVS